MWNLQNYVIGPNGNFTNSDWIKENVFQKMVTGKENVSQNRVTGKKGGFQILVTGKER